MELKEKVGKILQLGMTNNVFANNCGISITTFNRWYKKGETLNPDTMKKIENYVFQVKNLIASV